MLLANFVFISVISFYLGFIVLAFFDFSSLRTHLWPFTEVLRKIWRSVTGKVAEDARIAGCTDETNRFLAGVRRGGCPTIAHANSVRPAVPPYHSSESDLRYPCNP